MIKLGFVLLIAVILVQGMLFWKYQRQVKDICRQLSFLMKHDSNMLITREMDFGGIGELADVLNEWLELKRREKKEYLKKEEMISDTYTNLSHDIRPPLTSLDGYFQLMEDGNKYKNITTFAECSIQQFRANPVIQVIAATKLAKSFEKCFDSKDRETAEALGITR